MAKCAKCNDSGVIETGNNDLPCSCPAGATALFNTSGVDGPITGAEMKRHFLNDSPEPLRPSSPNPIPASSLPGRREGSVFDQGALYVTWGQFKEMMQDVEDDTPIIMSKDAEGNAFSPLSGPPTKGIYVPTSTWSGEFQDKPNEDTKAIDSDYYECAKKEDGAVEAICLWPTN